MRSSTLLLVAATVLTKLGPFMAVTSSNEPTEGNGTYLHITTRNPTRQQQKRDILGVAHQKRDILGDNDTPTSISATSSAALWKRHAGHSTPGGNDTEASTGTPTASAGFVKREVSTTQETSHSGPVTPTGHKVEKRQATVGTLGDNATKAFTDSPVSADLVKREARTTQETTEGGSLTPTGHQVKRQADTTVGTSSTFPASTSRLVKRCVTRFPTSNYASSVASNLVKQSVGTTVSLATAGEDSNSTTPAAGL